MVFSESFQYVNVPKALKKVAQVSAENGHLLICDFFRQPGTGRRPLGGGHDWGKFQDQVSSEPFDELKNVDITDETAPTMDILDRFLLEVADPVRTISARYMDSNYSRIMKLFRWYFSKRLTKIEKTYFSGVLTGKKFKELKTYRLLLYRIRTG